MVDENCIQRIVSDSEFWSLFYISDAKSFICNKNLLPWECETTDSILDVLYSNRNDFIPEDMKLYEYIYRRRNSYTSPVNILLRLKSGDVFRLIFGVKNNNIIIGTLYKNLNGDVIDSVDSCSTFSNYISSVIKNDTQGNYAIIQVDIEKFKIINDNYGDSIGDLVLNNIANRLKVLTGSEMNFTRLASDIFVILYKYADVKSLIECVTSWDTILNHFEDIHYRLTWGIYIVEDVNVSGRVMIDSATIARQNMKGNALNNIGFYEETQKEELKHIKSIEEKMEQALENNEFKVYIQPKYSASNHSIIGGESLVRWILPDGSMIYPSDFIPIFEKNGFVVKVDRFVWYETCKKLREWLDKGYNIVPISVNMSRRHLEDLRCVDFIEQTVKEFNLDRKYLQLEITETLDNVCECEVFLKLKELGYSMLMDDFGSGYSSLNTLKTTNFDVIKLDRAFLSEFLHNKRGQKIIRHTISMIKDIDLGIVAEGVETLEQADYLRKSGCDVLQGFYFSKPLSLEEFENLIK